MENIQDNEIYKDYLKNIEVLYDTVKITDFSCWFGIGIYIIDNNKKHFKKKYLYNDFIYDDKGTTTKRMKRVIDEVLVDEYVTNKVKYTIRKNELDKITKELKEMK